MALEHFHKVKAAVTLALTVLASVRSIPITKPIRTLRICFLIFFCFCGLSSTRLGRTQKSVDPPCTALELRCPTYVVSSTGRITFQTDVVGAKKILGEERTKVLAYEWEVSGGKIIGGQGTPTIVVEPANTQLGGVSCLTVTVGVKGLLPECENKKSCALRVDSKCAPPNQFDKYGDLPFKDEKAHLDNLARSLMENGPESITYILAYAGRGACISEAEWRANRAKKYLIEQHKIQDDRIIVVDGGFRDALAIQLFLLPRKVCGPFPTATVGTSEAQISGPCSDKYK